MLDSNFFISPENFTSESARSPFNFSENASISVTAFLASDNCCCNSNILVEKIDESGINQQDNRTLKCPSAFEIHSTGKFLSQSEWSGF